MAKKTAVTLDLYNDEHQRSVVEGRLLGYINDEEFAAIITHHYLQRSVATSKTITLNKIDEADDKLINKRLVLMVKKIDGKTDLRNQLFITEKITEKVCYTQKLESGVEYMSLETKAGNWMALTED